MSDDTKELPFQLFDPRAEVLKLDRCLPHWSQAGTLCFITWRSDDSIPQPVLSRWLEDRWNWLNEHGLDPSKKDWKEDFDQLDAVLRCEFQDQVENQWHKLLDQGHGACVLRRPELSKIVADSLHYFDNQRYVLTDFVVMPNHVHLICAFADEDAMLNQCESWKHYTATQINRRLGQRGRFWQQDGFDHLIRSVEEFQQKRRYLAENPQKAGLRAHEFVHFAKML